jgi:Tfp pilus assembly protein PilX
MTTLVQRNREERGIALVVAMLVLLVVTVMAILLVSTASVTSKISGHVSRRERALSLAEAGVAEAISRLGAGDVPQAVNANMVTQIYNVASGSVPVLGSDSTALATSQPAGSWLSYTTASRGPNALTVQFKTDGQGHIYRYDSGLSPAINLVSGTPIFQITSTGTVGTTKRTVVTDVVSRPPTFNGKGGYTAGSQIEVHEENGPFFICGYNHLASTPDWQALNVGRGGPNPGVDAQHSSCLPFENGSYDNYGVWSGGSMTLHNGNTTGKIVGSPAGGVSGQPGSYTGPWDALGMTQADFAAWLPARRSTAPTNWNGIFYLDKDATLNNNTGSNPWSFTNVVGSGFLYIDGGAQINGTIFWKGLIYINGQFQHQGKIWVLGSFIGSGQIEDEAANNGGCILYSKDAVETFIAQYGGTFTALSWREKS